MTSEFEFDAATRARIVECTGRWVKCYAGRRLDEIPKQSHWPLSLAELVPLWEPYFGKSRSVHYLVDVRLAGRNSRGKGKNARDRAGRIKQLRDFCS
jgi:hypothetical protein